jgi:hypothetical protein
MPRQRLDDFKKAIGEYMAVHGKACTYYRETISYGLLQHVGNAERPKTLRDVLGPGYPVAHELEHAHKKLMQQYGISRDSAGVLRECGVTISELRGYFAGRLLELYNARVVAEIMDLAARKLALRLTDAILDDLGRFEGTGSYEDALDYLLDIANLREQYMTAPGETVTHAVVTAALRNPLSGNLDQHARAEYRRTH